MAPVVNPLRVEPVSAEPPPMHRRTVLRQRWEELAYFHWRYPPTVVQALLPDGLVVDTFDGDAWVGLIPFEMRKVRPGPAPVVPWIGHFVEINVRTYVVDRLGRRSVWFFSLDVPRTVVVGVARTVFALPYCWADAGHEVDGDRHRYWMRRRWPRGGHGALNVASPAAEMDFTVGAPVTEAEETDLDRFLSARWGLVTARRSGLVHGRVHHPRWALRHIDEVAITQDVVEAAGLPTPVGDVHARYAPGVPVELAWLRPIDDRGER